jgi:hypothetical protein
MRVIATKLGFYGGARVREGQVFDVPEGIKGKWFKPFVETAEAPAKSAESKKAKPQKGKADNGPTTFSEIAKQDAALIPKCADDLV